MVTSLMKKNQDSFIIVLVRNTNSFFNVFMLYENTIYSVSVLFDFKSMHSDCLFNLILKMNKTLYTFDSSFK